MKFATFIEAPANALERSQHWIASTYVGQIRAAAPTLRGCVYRICRPSPGTFFDSFEEFLDPNFGKFDALIESWFSSAEDFRREFLPLENQLEALGMRYASYHVTPRLQLDARVTVRQPPGRLADLPRSDRDRRHKHRPPGRRFSEP